MKEIRKFSLTLLMICLSASLCLSLVYALTKPQIEKQNEIEELASLKEIIPTAKSFNPIEKEGQIIYYEATDAENNIIAYAFKAYGKGYSSTIETLIGMTKEGEILNIKILNHNETPGLGSRITEVEQKTTLWEKIKSQETETPQKPWFQKQFSNRNFNELDKIDAISGATISSKAVIDSIKKKTEEILNLVKNEQ